MSKCILKFLIIFFSLNSLARLEPTHLIKSSLEQVEVPITKTYSLRANSIMEIYLKVSPGTALLDITIELNNGRSLNLDIERIKNKEQGKWSLKKVDIKMLTFTAKANSVDTSNIEFRLIQ